MQDKTIQFLVTIFHKQRLVCIKKTIAFILLSMEKIWRDKWRRQ